MPPKIAEDNCKPCNDRKKACNGQNPARTCLRSAAGQAAYGKKNGAGSAAAAIADRNAQREQKGQDKIALLLGNTAANNHFQPALAIAQRPVIRPSTPAPVPKDRNSDREEMLKPLPFFDEVEGRCELCEEPPTAHAFWCGRIPMNQKK